MNYEVHLWSKHMFMLSFIQLDHIGPPLRIIKFMSHSREGEDERLFMNITLPKKIVYGILLVGNQIWSSQPTSSINNISVKMVTYDWRQDEEYIYVSICVNVCSFYPHLVMNAVLMSIFIWWGQSTISRIDQVTWHKRAVYTIVERWIFSCWGKQLFLNFAGDIYFFWYFCSIRSPLFFIYDLFFDILLEGSDREKILVPPLFSLP